VKATLQKGIIALFGNSAAAKIAQLIFDSLSVGIALREDSVSVREF
jgi:hypothetical protein